MVARGLRYHFFRYRYDTDTMQVWIFDTDTILILFSYKISIPILILILFSYKISIPILILILPSNGLIPNLIPKFAWNCHFSAQKSMKSVLLIAFQGPWRHKVSTDTEFETCFGERWYWYWYWYFNVWNFDTDTDTDTFQVENFDTDTIPIRYFELKVSYFRYRYDSIEDLCTTGYESFGFGTHMICSFSIMT